jgi:anti-sigma regulatory factor (Ser/Thr protein kinase)
MTDGYVHHALLFGSDAELVRVAAPFLAEGLVAGDAVVLACEDRKNRVLADALGGDPRIGFLERSRTYLRTPVAVATYRRMVEGRLAGGARRVRLVGEVDFGQDPATWDEWIRYEAICNVALAPYPFWSVCAYDTGVLPEPILRSAHRTHPNLLTAAGRRRNRRYVPPARFLGRSRPAPPDPLEQTDPVVVGEDLADLTQLRTLRDRVHRELVRVLVPDPTRSEFVSAVGEVAANGLLHGRPPVQVRVWASLERLVATVTDRGDGFDDPLAGYAPSRGRDPRRAGMGLWLTRQLCDQLELSRTAERFVVRLIVAIPQPAGSRVEREALVRGHAETAKARAAKARALADEMLRRYDQLEAEASALERRQALRQPPRPGHGDDPDPAG